MAVMAVLVEKKSEKNASKEDKEIAAKISEYFHSSVLAAQKMIHAHDRASKDDGPRDAGHHEIGTDDEEDDDSA